MPSTRSSAPIEPEINTTKKTAKAPALLKVFYLPQSVLSDPASSELKVERFYHPGKGETALFLTHLSACSIREIIEFAEPRRSWLINNDICSNGRIYLTTPIDGTFLALHHIRKHCATKALPLDNIGDEHDKSTAVLFRDYLKNVSLNCVADVKTIPGSDLQFFKYNAEKSMAWLAVKTRRLKETLKQIGVHCGHSALSQNYTRSETVTDELVQEVDYLRMAYEIICGYIDLDMHDELSAYLELPAKEKKDKENEEKEQKVGKNKRKSLQSLNSDNKKVKMEQEEVENESVTDKLRKSDLVDKEDDDDDDAMGEMGDVPVEVLLEECENRIEIKSQPVKERVLTTKEKALAKSAKGTKSIASFFKK